MPNDILMVYSSPKSPEREDEYNQWYNDFHLRQMLKLNGIIAATRYVLSRVQTLWYPPMVNVPEWPYGTHPYLAMYEIDRKVGVSTVLENIRNSEQLRQSADPSADPVRWGEHWFFEIYAQREQSFQLAKGLEPSIDRDANPFAVWLVPTTPVSPESDNEYHKWYNLQGVLRNEGFEAITRYRLSRTQGRIDSRGHEPAGDWPHAKHHFLAIWDVSDVYQAWGSRRRSRDAMNAAPRPAGGLRYPWMAAWPPLHHADEHIFYEPVTRRVVSPWLELRA